MSKAEQNQRTFHLREDNIGDVCSFAETLLARKDVNGQTANEAILVFEALMQKLIDWGLDEDTDLDISGVGKLGDFRIIVGFEGNAFALNDDADASYEDKILRAHDDKLDYSYFSGYNEISISVSRSHRTSFFACIIATLCAVAVYIPLNMLLDIDAQHDLLNNYVFPLETMYANAMLMIGAPMTFFSLLKNLTDTYIVSRRNSGIRQLQARTLATSVLATLLAFVSFFFLSTVLLSEFGGTSSELGGSVNRSFADIVTSLIPPSIFEPFESISPLPLIVVALLCAYALCSAGKYFDALRGAMMACYTLFSRMLHVVIAVLPVFCFLAIMDVLLEAGITSLVEDAILIIGICLGFILLFASYAIRLRAHGVAVVPFVRKLRPLLRENASIGSAIDAAPYNVRYCARTYKMHRPILERNLPVLAEINLDGNCFILMSMTLVFAFVTDTQLSWVNLVALAFLILFLSYGAPNQPGSILIGTLIITMYLNSFDVVCIAIFTEAYLGNAQNLINVIGDIVMAAIDDSKAKGQDNKAKAQA